MTSQWGVSPRLCACSVVLCVLGISAGGAHAEMRCHGRVVHTGLSDFEVLERCGEPVHERSYGFEAGHGFWVQVDEWLYDLGRNRFRRNLVFVDGRLEEIETRDKPVRRIHTRR